MSLTPEMEALVPEVSRELFKALTGGRAGKPKLIDLAAARAIIPLIYTAGLRAGREEAAKVAEASEARLAEMWDKTYALREMLRVQLSPGSEALRSEYEAANELHYLVGGRGNVAAAIRNLSEQEKSRG